MDGVGRGDLCAMFFQHGIQPSLHFRRLPGHAFGQVVRLSNVAFQVVEFLASVFVKLNEFPVPDSDRAVSGLLH